MACFESVAAEPGFWEILSSDEVEAAVVALAPASPIVVDEDYLDDIARAYVGLAARPDAAAIVLRGEAPTSIVWEGNTGPLTSPIVLNPGGGRSIADPAAYFAAWRAATGKPDEKPFFDWRISDCRAGHFRSRSRDARNGLSRKQLTAVSERLPPATAQPQKSRPRLKRAE